MEKSSTFSLLGIDDLSSENIDYILKTALFFKEEFYKEGKIIHCIDPEQSKGLVVQLLFAEPSTRTRASFEVACGKLGVAVTSLWNLPALFQYGKRGNSGRHSSVFDSSQAQYDCSSLWRV